MVSHMECAACEASHDLAVPAVCVCGGGPLLVRYYLDRARTEIGRAELAQAPADMWRYASMLPLADAAHLVSIGEGWTPLVRARRLGEHLGLDNLWLKDESANPLGTCEARAYSTVLSVAREMGAQSVAAVPDQRASVACASYAALAGIPSKVQYSADWQIASASACHAFGAEPIGDAPAFDPFRTEGLKTIAYEIAEQFDWVLPRLVVCPGAALAAALQKGFDELRSLDWVSGEVEVCCTNPQPVRDAIDAGLEIARLEGLLPSLDSAACLAEVRSRNPSRSDAVVWINAASGLLDGAVYARRFPGGAAAQADKLGGLITPR